MRPLVGTAQALGIVSIAALERASQRNDAARLSLLAELETLRGIVAREPTDAPPAAPGPPAARSRMDIPGVGAAVAGRACPRYRVARTAAQYGAARPLRQKSPPVTEAHDAPTRPRTPDAAHPRHPAHPAIVPPPVLW